jgi:TonB-dependent receptor
LLADDLIFRASYSTGISRPNFVDLVPYSIFSDVALEVSRGNPDLKPTYAHNFDLMLEYYTRPLGLVSGGLFYKRLSDPMFDATSTIAGGAFDGYVQSRPENADSGRIWGLEVNLHQDVPFVPGLSAILNYTWADSSADLPFGIGKTDLAGTSTRSYNAALRYELMGFSTQVAYNSRSEYIDSYNVQDPQLNVYWGGRATLDWTARYRINSNFTVFAELNNIEDSRQIRFQGSRARVFEHEDFGRTFEAGVRVSF